MAHVTSNPDQIVTITVRLAERERADALAAELGVTRSKLLRAALIAAADADPELARSWLERVPASRRGIEWRARLLAVLPMDGPGLILDEIIVATVAGQARWRPALDGLVADGLVAPARAQVSAATRTASAGPAPPGSERPRERGGSVRNQGASTPPRSRAKAPPRPACPHIAAWVLRAVLAYEADDLDALAACRLTPLEAAVFGELHLCAVEAVHGRHHPPESPSADGSASGSSSPRPPFSRPPAPRRPRCVTAPGHAPAALLGRAVGLPAHRATISTPSPASHLNLRAPPG